MDVKITFLNGDLEKQVYVDQPKGFLVEGKDHMMCKLKKSIYQLKQVSRQWCIKFNDTITSFNFEENLVNRCIYRKINRSKIIIIVLYVDDILLATNDLGLLHNMEEYLTKNFKIKDMGETSYVIGIEIFHNRL